MTEQPDTAAIRAKRTIQLNAGPYIDQDIADLCGALDASRAEVHAHDTWMADLLTRAEAAESLHDAVVQAYESRIAAALVWGERRLTPGQFEKLGRALTGEAP